MSDEQNNLINANLQAVAESLARLAALTGRRDPGVHWYCRTQAEYDALPEGEAPTTGMNLDGGALRVSQSKTVTVRHGGAAARLHVSLTRRATLAEARGLLGQDLGEQLAGEGGVVTGWVHELGGLLGRALLERMQDEAQDAVAEPLRRELGLSVALLRPVQVAERAAGALRAERAAADERGNLLDASTDELALLRRDLEAQRGVARRRLRVVQEIRGVLDALHEDAHPAAVKLADRIPLMALMEWLRCDCRRPGCCCSRGLGVRDA